MTPMFAGIGGPCNYGEIDSLAPMEVNPAVAVLHFFFLWLEVWNLQMSLSENAVPPSLMVNLDFPYQNCHFEMHPPVN